MLQKLLRVYLGMFIFNSAVFAVPLIMKPRL